jgi:hypothetical protein
MPAAARDLAWMPDQLGSGGPPTIQEESAVSLMGRPEVGTGYGT